MIWATSIPMGLLLMVTVSLGVTYASANRICDRMRALENQMLDLWQNEVEKRLKKIDPDATPLE